MMQRQRTAKLCYFRVGVADLKMVGNGSPVCRARVMSRRNFWRYTVNFVLVVLWGCETLVKEPIGLSRDGNEANE